MKSFQLSFVKPEFLFLIEKYPEFFLDLSDTTKEYEGDVNLRFGFECGAGWVNILDEHFQSIRDLIARKKAEGVDCHYHSCIIKEKFGGCLDQGDFHCADTETVREYWGLTRELEAKSYKVCEITGRAGKSLTSDRGWVKTLCPEEAEKRGYT